MGVGVNLTLVFALGYEVGCGEVIRVLIGNLGQVIGLQATQDMVHTVVAHSRRHTCFRVLCEDDDCAVQVTADEDEALKW